jgi:hypothetical protein
VVYREFIDRHKVRHPYTIADDRRRLTVPRDFVKPLATISAMLSRRVLSPTPTACSARSRAVAPRLLYELATASAGSRLASCVST